MTKRWWSLLAPLSLALLLSACAPPAVVFLSAKYQGAKVQRVALVDFEDFPSSAGSGRIAAGIFEKYLLLGGYSLVDRRQVAAVMEKQSYQSSSNLDLEEVRALGKLLGVDAIAFGQLTGFTDSSDRTVVVDMPLEQTSPIFGRVVTVQRDHGTETRTVQDVVTGYSTTSTDQPVQQTETVYASVGMTVRLVDVASGELLWSASSTASGAHLSDATEAVSAQIMHSVAEKLKKP